MTTKRKSPATKRAYRVYATDVLFQDVEATSAEEAYWIADEAPCFESCGSCLQLDPDVKDVATDRFIRVGAKEPRCKTCGSEIVVTINDSNFNEGECGPCEYQRYRSQPSLLKTIVPLLNQAEDMLCELYDTDDPKEWPWIVKARAAIAKANGRDA